jgi:hypothetical protein
VIDVKDFVGKIREIASEQPKYRLGGDGSDGTCDCIGLIIGAIRRAGGQWEGIHGSNWAARNAMEQLNKKLDATQLQIGWAVFKAKAPGESGYDLPSRYDDDDERMDFYHVGVVTGVEPLQITHCTSSGAVDGIAMDNKQGAWIYGGPLQIVDYGEEMEKVYAEVTAPSGTTVNMRKTPVPNGTLVDRVPVGDQVEVLSSQLTWTLIKWSGKTGYMMTKHLKTKGGEEIEEAAVVTIKLSEGAAKELLKALQATGIQ